MAKNKRVKLYLYTTLLTLPVSAVLYYILYPPQCPADYTQAQVDASRCIVGANIGGPPMFIGGTVAVWLVLFWLAKRTINRRQSHAKRV